MPISEKNDAKNIAELDEEYAEFLAYKEKKEQNKAFLKDYYKSKYKQFVIKFRIEEDSDILDKLSKQKNTTKYLRSLILADIEKEKKAAKKSK